MPTYALFLQDRLPLPPSEQEKEVPVLWREVSSDVFQIPIKRVTFALDFRALAAAAQADGGLICENGNALFLHRPFDLPPDFWPDAPVFSSHRGLDAHLSVGCNHALAATLNFNLVAEVRREETDALPIGMICELPEALPFGGLLRRLSTEFGGMEAAVINGRETVSRIAIMGAMTPGLLQKADEAGAQAYLTGQVRDIARKEAEKRNTAVFATGHDRAEWWGLRFLAGEMKQAFSGLETRVVR